LKYLFVVFTILMGSCVSDNQTEEKPTEIIINVGDNLFGVKTIGGVEVDTVWQTKTDPEGNVYIAGTFHATVDFDPSENIDNHIIPENDLAYYYGYGFYISKYDKDGNYQWTRTGNGDGNSIVVPKNIHIDGDGNVYLSGTFAGTINFGSEENEYILSCGSMGESNEFIMKYNNSGSFQWARGFYVGDSYMVKNNLNLSTDSANNLLVLFENSDKSNWIKYDDHIEEFEVETHSRFSMKFSETGNFIETKLIDYESEENQTFATGFIMDINDNSYIISDNSQIYKPYETTDIPNSIYITKLDSNDELEWQKEIRGIDNQGYSMFIDTGNQIKIIGMFDGEVDFNPNSGVDNRISENAKSIFITVLDLDGNYIGTGTTLLKDEFCFENITIKSILTNDDNNIFISGDFEGSFLNHDSLGESDIFIEKL
jgi:hypothetical protein